MLRQTLGLLDQMKPFISLSHIISVKTLAMLSQVYETFISRRSRQIRGNKLEHTALQQEDASIYYLKCVLFINDAFQMYQNRKIISFLSRN